MGVVGSKPEDGCPLYLRDQSRLAITSVKIVKASNRILYTILPNTYPTTRYTVRKEDDDESLVEYIQDPESASSAPSFLLRLNNDEDIYFYFTFLIKQGQVPTSTSPNPDASNRPASMSLDTVINSLTFTFASTPKEVETLVTREFNADPNLHRNPNVDLVGDYSTAGKAQEQFEWSWKWRPPKQEKDKGGGWRNTCSFVEYDQRAHRLNTLVTFSFWVHNVQGDFSNPRFSPPRGELTVPTSRVRLPSSQSIESRVSDSDTELETQIKSSIAIAVQPEAIPEYGSLESASTASNPVKVDISWQKPGEDLSSAEDGPVFRATLKAMEQRTGPMRARIKKVLKKAEIARETQVACNEAVVAFMVALKEAASSNANAVQPALDHYFEKIVAEILEYEKQNSANLQRLIIDPISKLYSNDIKQVDSKKKEFEDESRDYYAYVGRYLGQRQDSLKDKKRAESDSKYQNKRKNFELKRFDYSSFIQDLHGGRKEQEVLSQLTKYADTQAKGYLATAKRVEALLPQLDALSFEVKEADKEYQLQRAGREEKRRALEKGSTTPADLPDSSSSTFAPSSSTNGNRVSLTPVEELSGNGYPLERPRTGVPVPRADAPPPSYLDPAMSTSPRLQQTQFSVSPGSDKFRGYRDLEEKDRSQVGVSSVDGSPRKEGLLWSMSKPGGHVDPIGLKNPNWHKFWVVLDQGKLSEYVNWKQNLEPHLDPIDLRVATVREARNAERRFCFEVITPSYTRTYQATSEDDMRSWIQAISNALQSAFENRQPPPGRSSSNKGIGSIAKDLFGKSSSFHHGHRATASAAANSQSSKQVARHATVGDRPPLHRNPSSEDRSSRFLQTIRDADAGNALCADCGCDSRVEWVSINLGIIICIECSGIHRSLGTHITKIRSLTLDTVSFTQDLSELLLQVGNRVSNSIWEANMDNTVITKPTPSSTRDQRLRFITAKFADKAFVQPLSPATSRYHSPDEHLLASIKKSDLQNVLYGLALGANPNATDRSRATPAVILALVAADPASPGTPSGSTTPKESHSAQQRKAFPIAELLIQNGAEIPTVKSAPFPLSRSAQLYLEFKHEQKQGRGALGHSISAAGASSTSANISSAAGGRAPVPVATTNSYVSHGKDLPISQSLPTHAETMRDDTLTALPSFDGTPGGASPGKKDSEKSPREKLVKRSSLKNATLGSMRGGSSSGGGGGGGNTSGGGFGP